MVDNFTKYVRLFTLRRATTAATLRRVHQYCKELGSPRVIITDNGTQFSSKKWLDGLTELNIQPRFTAIRNPCANLAERINRQLGNLFRIFVGDQHTKWSRYVPIVESCINETYHETIEVTPYEAQLGKKPTRAWEKYINKDMLLVKGVDHNQIFIKMKEKREKQAKLCNEIKTITKFKIGEKVLIRTYHQSDAVQKRIEKFCELYCGPYKAVSYTHLDVYKRQV